MKWLYLYVILTWIYQQALCIILYVSSVLANTSEERAREIIEEVLRIPNRDRGRNSVLDRLERTLQQELTMRQRQTQEHCDDQADVSEVLPEYTESLQSYQERGLRQLGGTQKHYPICHLKRKIRRLNTSEYEYRPAYYEEVRCVAPAGVGDTSEICTSLGFSCVQWNKTIHLTRRRYTSDCWETKTMVIPAGCECMWPVHRLGDLALQDQSSDPMNVSD